MSRLNLVLAFPLILNIQHVHDLQKKMADLNDMLYNFLKISQMFCLFFGGLYYLYMYSLIVLKIIILYHLFYSIFNQEVTLKLQFLTLD